MTFLGGKGGSGQAGALHGGGRRCAPTPLALQAAPALSSRPLARRSRSPGSPASGLASSAAWPAAAALGRCEQRSAVAAPAATARVEPAAGVPRRDALDAAQVALRGSRVPVLCA